MMSGHSPAAKAKRRRRGDQPAQEFGELFAGVAGVELGQTAVVAAAERFERDDRGARDLGKLDLGAVAEGGKRRQRGRKPRKHVARCVDAAVRSGARTRTAGAARRRARQAAPRTVPSSAASPAGRCRRAARPARWSRPRGARARRSRPSDSSGCFSSASTGTGSPGRNTASQHQREQCGRRRVGERRAAGIVGADAEAQQLGRDAARQVAVAGDQRGGAAGLVDGLPAARWRSPPPRRARCARFDQRHAGTAPRRCRRPKRGAARRPSRRWSRPAAAPRDTSRARSASGRSGAPISSTSPRSTPILPSSFARPNCGWPSTAGLRRGVRQHRPGRARRVAVSRPGSTTAPLRQPRDRPTAVRRSPEWSRSSRRRSPGRRADCASAAPPPARISALRCAAGLELAALGEEVRPVLGDDRQEIERHLPPAGEVAGDQLAQAASSPSLRSRSRPSARRGRAPARWHRRPRPAPPPLPRTAPRHGPAAASSRRAPAAPEEQPVDARRSAAQGRARRAASARRPPRPRRTRRAGGSTGRIAERPPSRSTKTRAQLARGAARRHVDGGVGQRQRVAVAGGSPGTSRPDSSASASVGRKGTPGGMEKTRGARGPLMLLRPAPRGDRGLGQRDRVGRADGDPAAVHRHAEQPAARRSPRSK